MKTLTEYINERYDDFGHELKLGDWVEFETSGVTVFGEITDIPEKEGERFTVTSAGWRGDPDFKPKKIYKLGDKRKCYQLNVTDNTREAFHKWLENN